MNLTSYYFEHLVAPFFFENFKDGEIWYVDCIEEDLNNIWKREYQLAQQHFNADDVLQGSAPQSMSGLFPYAFHDAGLSLPLLINYPNIYGKNVYTLYGNLIFVPIEGFNVFDTYEVNIFDLLRGKLDLLYSDVETVSAGIRLQTSFIDRTRLLEYIKWYIEKLSILIDFIYEQENLDSFYLLSLTLSRICVETYLIHISSSIFDRKNSIFNLLDKYANIIRFINNSHSDTEIWKILVKKSFFDDRLEPMLSNIDRSINSSFAQIGRIIYEDNLATISFYDRERFTEEEISDLLRAYRNTHHGYLLNPKWKKLILSHEGNISNYLPDLCIILWHAILENPSQFFDLFI